MSVPSSTEGSSGANAANQQSQQSITNPMSSTISSNDAVWVRYFEAQHLPGNPIPTPQDIAELKQSVLATISANMGQINAAHEEAAKYPKAVAEGNE